MMISDGCMSCAVKGLVGVGDHKNAIEAMKSFCQTQLGFKDSWTPYTTAVCYYVFCAGPEVPKEHPNGSHHSKEWVRYGTEFAQFIVENNLGEVITTGQKFNARHHPTTTAQVWVWSPDQKNLEAWWDKHGGNRKIGG